MQAFYYAYYFLSKIIFDVRMASDTAKPIGIKAV